jgi:hypothetical protein
MQVSYYERQLAAARRHVRANKSSDAKHRVPVKLTKVPAHTGSPRCSIDLHASNGHSQNNVYVSPHKKENTTNKGQVVQCKKTRGFDHGHTTPMGWSDTSVGKWGDRTPRPIEMSQPIHQRHQKSPVYFETTVQGPMFGSNHQINLHRQRFETLKARQPIRLHRPNSHSPRSTNSISNQPPQYSPRFPGSVLDSGYSPQDWT